jgi:streptogramin lyase
MRLLNRALVAPIGAIVLGIGALTLAACAGQSTNPSVLPARPDSALRASHRRVVRVKMRIVIPAIPHNGPFARRLLRGGRQNPFFTATSTQGIDVKVSQGGVLVAETQTDISAGSANCVANADVSRTCTFPMPAPPGADVFAIATYDGAPVAGGGFGSASQLGRAALSQTLTAGTAYNFAIALSGIVHTLSLVVPFAAIHGTLASAQALGVYALDADDNIILDSQYYDAGGSPIKIALKLGTAIGPGKGTFALSATAFPSPPANAVVLTYDGNATIPAGTNSGAFSTTITASVTGGTSPIAAVGHSVTLIGPAIQAFSVGGSPLELTLGPDGNVWFTDTVSHRIGTIGPGGTAGFHSLPAAAAPHGIVAGSDGNLWFTDTATGKIGWVAPGAGPGHECSAAVGSAPNEIINGPSPDGAAPYLYVVQTGQQEIWQVGAYATSCLSVYGLYSVANASGTPQPLGLALGPDANIWYTESQSGTIESMTSAGAPMFSATLPKSTSTICSNNAAKTASPDQIVTGPNATVWFSEDCAADVGRITPTGPKTGTVTMFPIGDNDKSHGIVAGPDGNVWIAQYAHGIVRVTPAGSIRIYGRGTAIQHAYGIAVGADADLWFADQSGNIGRFVW